MASAINARVERLAYLGSADTIAAHIRYDTGGPCTVAQVQKVLDSAPKERPVNYSHGKCSNGFRSYQTSAERHSAVQGSRALLVAIARSKLKAKRLPKGHRAYWQQVVDKRGAI